jgi:hypothetical protein
MKKLSLLILTGCTLVAVICLAVRTELPAQFWLFVIGLAGPVVAVLQYALRQLGKVHGSDDARYRSKKI